jgi:hypothetical protein
MSEEPKEKPVLPEVSYEPTSPVTEQYLIERFEAADKRGAAGN